MIKKVFEACLVLLMVWLANFVPIVLVERHLFPGAPMGVVSFIVLFFNFYGGLVIYFITKRNKNDYWYGD